MQRHDTHTFVVAAMIFALTTLPALAVDRASLGPAHALDKIEHHVEALERINGGGDEVKHGSASEHAAAILEAISTLSYTANGASDSFFSAAQYAVAAVAAGDNSRDRLSQAIGSVRTALIQARAYFQVETPSPEYPSVVETALDALDTSIADLAAALAKFQSDQSWEVQVALAEVREASRVLSLHTGGVSDTVLGNVNVQMDLWIQGGSGLPVQNLIWELEIQAAQVREYLGDTEPTPWVPRFIRGDSNGDGHVQLSDAVHTLVFLFSGGEEPPCQKAADTDANQSIEMNDALITLQELFSQQGSGYGVDLRDCTVDIRFGLTCERPGPCPR